MSPIDRGLDELLAPLGELADDLVAVGGRVEEDDLAVHLAYADLLDLLVPHGQAQLVEGVQHPVENGLGPQEMRELVHESREEPVRETVFNFFYRLRNEGGLTGRRVSGSACWGC